MIYLRSTKIGSGISRSIGSLREAVPDSPSQEAGGGDFSEAFDLLIEGGRLRGLASWGEGLGGTKEGKTESGELHG